MAECSFNFKIQSDPTGKIEKVRTKIEQEGGSFNGSENEGTFSLPTPLGVVEGNYSLTNDDLKIDITRKPAFIPCTMLESELKKNCNFQKPV